MSDIVLGKDIKTGKDVKMGYGTLYKGEPELKTLFYRFIDWYTSYDRKSLPRHGIFSIVGRRTNFYIYDHPAITNMCRTAFTNGDAVFFQKDFFASLLEKRQTRGPNGEQNNLLEFILTHELAHILKMHFSRLKNYTPEESNLIGDMNINLEIRRTFKWQYPQEQVIDFVGFRDIDMDLYGHLSEESIGRLFMIKRNEILIRDCIDLNTASTSQKMNALTEVIWGKRAQDNDKSQTSSSGNGDTTQEQSIDSNSDANNSDENNGDEHKGDGSHNNSDEHMISNEDLANALIEAGDKDLADQLGISPDLTDEEKAKAIQVAKDKLTNDLAEAQNDRKRAENKGIAIPGKHIEDALDDSLKVDRQAKIKWNLAVQEMIYGNGMESIENDGLMDDIFFIDPSDMGLGDNVYIPAQIPFEENKGSYIFILDTSASMTMDDLEESTAEIQGMLEGIENDETKIFLVSSDTVSRGDVLEINAGNVVEKFEELKLYGRGGTDLTAGIVSAMELVQKDFPDYPISGIVFGTDLGDTAPSREDLPDDLPPVIFITSPDSYNTHFHAAVKDFATVVTIEDGSEANFDNDMSMSI
ncbi:VWA-like domain-containing protein (plasmid) [Alteromonas macleodii]|uniref:VWA-like domain-containing protein n=1 Tax=Alteromonas macleodii TaxID=28108 RepID=UPI0030CF8245